MNLSDITTKAWILALFIRDDGERFLLGDGWYDFKDSLQHFQPNTLANDIVELQGTDGQLLAGQVRRSATQNFDGYVGDASANKQTIEQRRRDFLLFFRKKHFYKVVYIFADGTSIQRNRGYLVDAPSIPELWQFFPEYHVGLAFEDVNYYEYTEDASGNETYSNVRDVRISAIASGGLVWDSLGAVSDYNWKGPQYKSGQYVIFDNPIPSAPYRVTEYKGWLRQNIYKGDNLQPTTWASTFVSAVNNTNKAKLATKENRNCVWFTMDAGYGSYATANFTRGITFEANTQYSFQFYGMKENGTGVTLGIYYSDGTWSVHSNYNQNGRWQYQTITSQPNKTILYACPYYTNGQTYIDISSFTVCKGHDVTDEPYVGKSPAPSPDYPQGIDDVRETQTFSAGGKNLFNISNQTFANSGVTFKTANNVITINGTTTRSAYAGACSLLPTLGTDITNYPDYIALTATNCYTLPSGTYTISADVTENGNITNGNSGILVGLSTVGSRTITSARLTSNQSSWTFTIADELAPAYERFKLLIAPFYQGSSSLKNVDTTIQNIQIERNGSATTYEAYRAPSTKTILLGTIRLAKVDDYQDRIYKQGDEWFIEKNIGYYEFDGTENWSLTGTNTFTLPREDLGAMANTDSIRCWFASPNENYGTNNNEVYLDSDNLIFSKMTKSGSNITTVSAWKTYLSSNNPAARIYYPLATPITTQITDSSLIEQLENRDTLTNDTMVMQLIPANYSKGELEVLYYTEYDVNGGYIWEEGSGGGGVTTIDIDGVDSALPIWTVNGPAIDPQLANITTNQTMKWTGTVPSGQTLIIDMDRQTASLAGANVFAYLSGDWVELKPGANRISYTAGGTDTPSTLSWNNIVG